VHPLRALGCPLSLAASAQKPRAPTRLHLPVHPPAPTTHYAALVSTHNPLRCTRQCTRQRVGQRIERPERRIFSLSSAFPRSPRHLRPRRLHHWNRTAGGHRLLFFFAPARLMPLCRLGPTPTGPRALCETTTPRPSVRRGPCSSPRAPLEWSPRGALTVVLGGGSILPYSEFQPPPAPATGVRGRSYDYRWNRKSRFYLHANFEKKECEMVLWFGGRESIFLFSHTNEFCGKDFVALEPGLACAPLKVGRWVYEKGRKFPGWQQFGGGIPLTSKWSRKAPRIYCT